MNIVKKNIEYILGFFLVFLWCFMQYNSWDGLYIDTDNYFHALRMVQWFEEPSFWEQKMGWSNYPFGEVSHWTRVLYIVWGVLSLPFLGSYPVSEAVFKGGILIGPLFSVLFVFFLLKGLQNILSMKFRLLVILLLGVQANFLRSLLLARPDHHAIFVFLSAFLLYLVKVFIYKKDDKTLRLIGISLGIGVWVAVEGMFLFLGMFLFFLKRFIFDNCNFDEIKRLLFWFLSSITLFWAINPCYEGWFYFDSGRISIFYVVLALSMYLGSFIADKFDGKVLKVSVIGGFSLAVMGGLWLLGWIKSPIDERIVPIFINRITEMEGINLYTGAYPFMGLVCGGLILRKKLKSELLEYILISLVLFSGLTLFGVRFIPYSGFYSAIVMAYFLEQRKILERSYKGLAVFFLCLEYISFIVNMLIFGADMPNGQAVMELNFEKFTSLGDGSVVSDTFFAPHIVWYGKRNVIASPYHRNVEGIIDNHKILFSSDENEVIELIKKHKARIVYLPDVRDDFYAKPLENCDKLYGKILGCKNYPKWLKAVNDKGDLFEIDYSYF